MFFTLVVARHGIVFSQAQTNKNAGIDIHTVYIGDASADYGVMQNISSGTGFYRKYDSWQDFRDADAEDIMRDVCGK